MKNPRSEYPRPQFVRREWLCLNGPWQFEIDAGDSGLQRGLLQRELKDRILVPFCPESTLSGIGNVDFLNAVWYRRTVKIPPAWKGRDVLLHFQACDYDATVWAGVGGELKELGRHRGGFTPFSFNLAGVARGGQTLTLVVRARDDHRVAKPKGKQVGEQFANVGCMYTRTTGIWQTVWLEPVAKVHMRRPRITPNVAEGSFHLAVPLSAAPEGYHLRATLRDRAGVVVKAQVRVGTDFSPQLTLSIPPKRRRLWDVGKPHLYDLQLELLDDGGRVIDAAYSYAGLRSVSIDGHAVKINGRCVFQRLVLDQGYYPDGIMTAPSDKALVKDIQLSMAAGFNGARLHQKVFEERFLYHADRMGYLIWGEFADWGFWRLPSHGGGFEATATYPAQWLEALQRDYSHPCIIGWCGMNEASQEYIDHMGMLDDVQHAMFTAAKAMDPTRPVLDVSGYMHRVQASDIWDSHDYEQNVEKFRTNHAATGEGKPFANEWGRHKSIPYGGQPVMVSEFGGTWWNPAAAQETSWGYGDRPKSIEEVYARFEGLCGVLLDNPAIFGYCYTQLTDVFLEQNGVVFFDRSMKLDPRRLRRAQVRPAAIEK